MIAAGPVHTPELARAEAANILRRLELAKQITTAEANAAYEDLLQLNLEVFSFDPFAERIWELRRNLTCYDAWHVAIAEALQLPLATLDMRLAKAAQPVIFWYRLTEASGDVYQSRLWPPHRTFIT